MTFDDIDKAMLDRFLREPEWLEEAIRIAGLVEHPAAALNRLREQCESRGIDFGAAVVRSFNNEKKMSALRSKELLRFDGGTTIEVSHHFFLRTSRK